MSLVCDPRPLATHDLPHPRDPSVAIELVSLTHELGIHCGNSGLLYPSMQALYGITLVSFVRRDHARRIKERRVLEA